MIRFLILVLVCSSDLFAFKLFLEPVVRTQGGPVRLSDVSRSEGDSPKDKVILGSIREAYFLSRDEIQRAAGTDCEAVYGPGVWVVPLTKTQDAEEAVESMKSAIRRLSGGEEFLKKHTIKVSAGLKMPEQGASAVYRLPPQANKLAAGRMIVAVDLIVPDNGKDRTLLRQQVELVIYRQVKVAVATHTLDQGDVIAHGDFKMETRELDSDVEKFAPENLVGQRLIDRVDAGKPIYASQLRKTSTVRRGQSITLIHQTPGIVVRCKSTSLTDAEPGGRIKVRILLPSGKKTDIREADVVDENTAVLAR